MTFPWFVSRLFVGAWASITLLLAVLFNFIEFFEKMARVKQASICQIFHFLGLNFLPSAFDVMPLGIWLATLFVLRELTMQQSWDFLQLIGFIPRKLVLLLMTLTFGLVLGVGVVRESFVLEIAQKAEQYKYAHFKKQQQDVIFTTWFELEDERFCYVEELDLARNAGKGLLLIAQTKQHDVASVTNAMQFTINPTMQHLQLEHAVTVHFPSQDVVRSQCLTVPSRYFFSIMSTKQRVYNLRTLCTTLLFSSYLPQSTVRTLGHRLMDNLWYYVSLLIYPALTIYLFSLPFGLLARWGLALLPYPIMMLLGMALKAAPVNGLLLLGLVVFLFVFFWRKYNP